MVKQKEVLLQNSTGRHLVYHPEDVDFMVFERLVTWDDGVDSYPLDMTYAEYTPVTIYRDDTQAYGLRLVINTYNLYNPHPYNSTAKLLLHFKNVINSNYVDCGGTEVLVDHDGDYCVEIATPHIVGSQYDLFIRPGSSFEGSCEIVYSGEKAPRLVLENDIPKTELSEYYNKQLLRDVAFSAKINSRTSRLVISDGIKPHPHMDFEICHTYGSTSVDTSLGKNIRLNLQDQLVPYTNATYPDRHYKYTDLAGRAHYFSEVYYRNGKYSTYFVPKSTVSVEADGRLYSEYYGTKQEVFRTYKTATSWTLETDLTQVGNSDYFALREEEYRQLKEQIAAYEELFHQYYIYDTVTKELVKVDTTVGGTTSAEANSFQFETIDDFKSSLQLTANQVCMSYDELMNMLNEENQLITLAPEDSPEDSTQDGTSTQADGDPATPAAAENGQTPALNALTPEQEAIQAAQYKILLEHSGKKDFFYRKDIKRLKQQHVAYINLKKQKEYYDKQYPKYILKDGELSKGYNADGKLVVIFDSLGHVLSVDRDDEGRITGLTDEHENKTEFCYQGGLLVSIKDSAGKQTKFLYQNPSDPFLSKIEREADSTELLWESMRLCGVLGSNGTRVDFYYDDGTTFPAQIATTAYPINGSNESSFPSIMETVSFSRNSDNTRVSICTDGKQTEHYVFDSEGYNTEYCVEKNGVVVRAERYDTKVYGHAHTYFANREQLNRYPYSDTFDFGEADSEEHYFNLFNQPLFTKTVAKRSSENGDLIKHTYTHYRYDEKHNCVAVDTQTSVQATNATDTCSYDSCKTETNRYNTQGQLLYSESYTVGEENTHGKTICEYEYNEKGLQTRSITYNSLDPSTRFYSECEHDDHGRVAKELTATGDGAQTYEYGADHATAVTQILPNGTKCSQGVTADGNASAITTSTADGEENSTQKIYQNGLLIKAVGGHTCIEYEHDHKRQLKKVFLNGVEYETYDRDVPVETGSPIKTDSMINAKGERFYAKKDALDRIVETGYGEDVLATYTYDVDGKLLSATDELAQNEESRTYDPLFSEKPATVARTASAVGGAAVTDSYSYNSFGQLTAHNTTVSGGVSQTYGFAYKDDAAKALDYVAMPSGLREYPQTDCNGRSTGRLITNSNGEKQFGEYVYYRKVGDHATNMPSSVYYGNTKNGSYEIRDNIKYAYDLMGNITEIRENGALSVRYTYDALNRLVREDNKKLARSFTFCYDNNGNILSKYEYAFTLCGAEALEEKTVLSSMQYSYDGDKLMRLTVTDENGTREEGFSYDAAGNPTTYRSNSAEWTRGRVMQRLGNTLFGYDAGGKRLHCGDVTFTYDADGRLIHDSRGITYEYGTQGVASLCHNGMRYFLRRDAQGNVKNLLDTNGNVVVHYVYDAWGNHVVLDASGNEISDTEHIGRRNPFRYRGYYYDEETGLYFLQTRYYDPKLGRFITTDSVDYADPDSINGLNLYAYCGNNPVMCVDPTGGFAISAILIGALIGIIIAVTATAVADYTDDGEVFNGSVSVDAYIINTLIGGIIGAILGGLGASALTAAAPTASAIASSASGAAVAVSSAAVAQVTGAVIAIGVLFMGNPTTRNPHDTSNPHRSTKNGKSNWDKHSKKRSGAPEKKDRRMKYRKWKRRATRNWSIQILLWLLGADVTSLEGEL